MVVVNTLDGAGPHLHKLPYVLVNQNDDLIERQNLQKVSRPLPDPFSQLKPDGGSSLNDYGFYRFSG